MSVLADTNILLRSAQPNHPHCSFAAKAVSRLLRQRQAVHYCPQTIAEFFNVATRPVEVNGLGYSDADAWKEIETIEHLLTILPETPEIYPEWKRLVREHNVRGLKVFDTRLVAIANVYGISQILTFNGSDFKRFANIVVIDPLSF